MVYCNYGSACYQTDRRWLKVLFVNDKFIIILLLLFLQRKEAQFFDNIVKTLRAESGYFRVGFYGQGFPTFLRVKNIHY
jgi:hypothetical protein